MALNLGVCLQQANVGDSRAIVSVKGAVHQLSYDHKPSNEGETKRIIAAGGWVEFNRVNGNCVLCPQSISLLSQKFGSKQWSTACIRFFCAGNLALSRAIGDFVFKKNDKKSAEEQIVTGKSTTRTCCACFGNKNCEGARSEWSRVLSTVNLHGNDCASPLAANPDVSTDDVTPDHEFLVMACDGIWDVLTNEEVVEFVRARIAQGMEPEIVSLSLHGSPFGSPLAFIFSRMNAVRVSVI